MPNIHPMVALSGWSKLRQECPANPAKTARVRRFEKCLVAKPRADSSALNPNRAMRNGWRGMRRSGPRVSLANSCQLSAAGCIKFRHALPSSPSARSVAAKSRSRTTAVPSSSGCANGASPWIHSNPCSASGSVLKNGEPAAKGWTAEPKSCRNPGSVSGNVRVAPPGSDSAS